MLQDKLKKHRNEIGLSQKDISEQLGITQQSYSNWEAGKSQPSPKNLKKIAKIFGVSPSYLLGWEDESKMDKMTVYIDKLIENTVNEKISWKYLDPYSDCGEFESYSEFQNVLFNELTEHDNYTLEERSERETFICAFSRTAILFHYYPEVSKSQLLAISQDENGKNAMIITSVERNCKLTELLEAIKQVQTGFDIETLDSFISDLQELEKNK